MYRLVLGFSLNECWPARITGDSLPCRRYWLAPLTESSEGDMGIMALRVWHKLNRSPINICYTSVVWDCGCSRREAVHIWLYQMNHCIDRRGLYMHGFISLVFWLLQMHIMTDFTVVVTAPRQLTSRTTHECAQSARKQMNTHHANWVKAHWLMDNQLKSEQLFI